MMKSSLCLQQRLWSVCADTQANLSLRRAHMSGTFSHVRAQVVLMSFGLKLASFFNMV